MKLYKKLGEIQKAIKGLSKDKKSHNFEYVTGNKLLSFLKPLMDTHGLILKQEILSIENVRQDYKTKYDEKSEILSKVMMKFTWVDTETGCKDENLFGANGQNGWDKGVGSALTYGERYFLLKYFHIATDEDDIDNPDLKPKEKETTTKEVIKKETPKPKRLEAKGFEFYTTKGTIDQIEQVLKGYVMSTSEKDILEGKLKLMKADLV